MILPCLGKNRVKGRNLGTKFDFKKSKIWHLIPNLTLKMAKSCKSDITSGFLDLIVHHGENSRQIRENKIESNLTSKIKIHDLWSHFWPWRWQNHANLTWPVNFSTSKILLMNFSDKSKKKISERCYKKRNVSKNSVVTKSVVTKSGDFLLQKAYF